MILPLDKPDSPYNCLSGIYMEIRINCFLWASTVDQITTHDERWDNNKLEKWKSKRKCQKVFYKWLVRLNFHSSGVPTFIFSYWLQCMKWILLYFDKLQTSKSSSLVITYITFENASLKSFCNSLWEFLFSKNVWKCPSSREKKTKVYREQVTKR